jgi:hypothetical protein
MNPTPTHVIVYSHGFGVRKEDRGLFTAIAKAFPDAHHVMFDYNPIHEESNTLTVKPITDQALKFRKVLNATRAEYPDAVIDIIAHSQGCVVVGLVKPRYIRKVIMLTPADVVNVETVVHNLSRNLEQPIDPLVKTKLARSDGSTTVIHPEYWQSLEGIKPVKLYNLLARVTTLRIMSAKQDEVLGEMEFEGLDPSISRVKLQGGHNFDDEESRKRLIYILQKELAN